MRQIKSAVLMVLVAAFISITAGCGGVPNYLVVPKQASPLIHKLGNEIRIPAPNHVSRYLDENQTIVYTQNFGGGGVGIGVLLGPFGVAANISMIEEITKADTLKLAGKIELDLVSLYQPIFNDLIKLKSDQTDSRAATITPVIDVIKMEEDKLGISVGLLVDYNQVMIAWKGKYRYKLTEDYTISGIAEGWTEEEKNSFRQSVTRGLFEVTKLYLDDVNGRLKKVRDVKFKSSFTSPRFNFEQMGQEVGGSEDRVYIRSYGQVISLPKREVVLTAYPKVSQ